MSNVAEFALERAQYILDQSYPDIEVKTAARALLDRLWEVSAAREAGSDPAVAVRVAKLIGRSADAIQPKAKTNALESPKDRAALAVHLAVKAAAMAVAGDPGASASFAFAANLVNRNRASARRAASFARAA